ncbi:unnamed protein product [Pleuronectes platessa]|uniref:Uncharacterized protein n=1 Tax=Pleuronectes platessa TaxID=8262 RepID=A0A9N7Z696_PLEPL|nr:unnamed protein product [Pleuronectes platessa]
MLPHPEPIEEANNGLHRVSSLGRLFPNSSAELNAVGLNHQSDLAAVDANAAIIYASLSPGQIKREEKSPGFAHFHLTEKGSPLCSPSSFYSPPRELFSPVSLPGSAPCYPISVGAAPRCCSLALVQRCSRVKRRGGLQAPASIGSTSCDLFLLCPPVWRFEGEHRSEGVGWPGDQRRTRGVGSRADQTSFDEDFPPFVREPLQPLSGGVSAQEEAGLAFSTQPLPLPASGRLSIDGPDRQLCVCLHEGTQSELYRPTATPTGRNVCEPSKRQCEYHSWTAIVPLASGSNPAPTSNLGSKLARITLSKRREEVPQSEGVGLKRIEECS